MNSSIPDIEVRFRVVGDFDPVSITHLLGVTPTSTRLKGDLSPNRRVRYDYSDWVISGGSIKTFYLEESVDALINKFQALDNELQILYSMEAADIYINCVISFGNEMPGIHLRSDQIKWLSLIGANLDIDLYQSAEE